MSDGHEYSSEQLVGTLIFKILRLQVTGMHYIPRFPELRRDNGKLGSKLFQLNVNSSFPILRGLSQVTQLMM